MVQLSPAVSGVVTLLARLIGLAIFAGLLAAAVALLYRWYVRERVPSGLALLVGLAGVAVVLNTTPLLAAEIAANDEAVEIVDALFNIVAFVGSGAAAFLGVRFGDRLGTDLDAAGGSTDVDADVSEIVQTVGRVTSVQLPDEIADIVGYDPVSESTKETLAGRRFLFPRRLTTDELRERMTTRLKTDYGVGYVDVEFGEAGVVEFLALGSRAAGIGPTLPPATNAVAIRADPAHAAGAGDLVQVWETDPVKRVLTGELRGVVDDVVTIAIDAADTPKLDPTKRYKLVTLPVQERPDREFASLLRAADETLATISIEAESDLDGVALEALDVTVAAITREDDRPEPLPARSRTLKDGDIVYVIATPEILRQVEGAAEGPAGGVPGHDPDFNVVEKTHPSEPSDLDAQTPEPIDGAPESTGEDPAPADADSADPEGEHAGVDIDPSDGANSTEPDADAASETGPDDANEALPSGDAPEETTNENVDATIDPGIDEVFDGDGDGDDLSAELEVDESTNGSGDGPEGEEVGPDHGSIGDDSEDGVPFTPLDVSEDDPLADPLIEPDADESGAPADEGSAAIDDEASENIDEESSGDTDESDSGRGD